MILPDELLFQILEYSAEEHDYGDDAIWRNGPFCDYHWALTETRHRSDDGDGAVEEHVLQVVDNRTRHEEMLKRSMKTKLAIILTCKRWLILAEQLLYRTIEIRKRYSLAKLLDNLDRNPQKGLWIKGIFVFDGSVRFGSCDLKVSDVELLLPKLVRHSTKLRAFLLYPSVASIGAFQEAFGALQTTTTLEFSTSYSSIDPTSRTATIPKLVSSLCSLRIDNYDIFFRDDLVVWGPSVDLPSLRTLALRNVRRLLLVYISSWAIPSLTWLDIGIVSRAVVNEVQCLLQAHGTKLSTLNLQSCYNNDRQLDFRFVLPLCPGITTLSFDIECHIFGHSSKPAHGNITRIGVYSSNTIYHIPEDEEDISFWFFHGQELLDPIGVHNVSMLNKSQFPRLSSIRIMSSPFATSYIRRGGVEAIEVSKSTPWIELRQWCAAESIRIEDVTGNEFGVPPSISGVRGRVVYEDKYGD